MVAFLIKYYNVNVPKYWLYSQRSLFIIPVRGEKLYDTSYILKFHYRINQDFFYNSGNVHQLWKMLHDLQ